MSANTNQNLIPEPTHFYNSYRNALTFVGLLIAINVVLNFEFNKYSLVTSALVLLAWFLFDKFKIRIKITRADLSFNHCITFLAILYLDKYSAIVIAASEAVWVTRKYFDKSYRQLFYILSLFAFSAWSAISIFEYFYDESARYFREAPTLDFIAALSVLALVYSTISFLVKNLGFLSFHGFGREMARGLQFQFWSAFFVILGAIMAGSFFQTYAFSEFVALTASLSLLFILYSLFNSDFDNFNPLENNQSKFQKSFKSSLVGMAIISSDGQWLQLNDQLNSLLKVPSEEFPEILPTIELPNKTYEKLIHRNDLPELQNKIAELTSEKTESFQIELRLFNLEHELVWVRMAVSKSHKTKSTNYHLIFQFQDITSQKKAEEQLIFDAMHDALTLLPNRVNFMSTLQRLIDSQKVGDKTNFATFFIDLDKFKDINDTLGHDAGDQVLKRTAERLLECVHGQDMVARLGGDEFTIISKNLSNTSDANLLAERILSKFAQPLIIDGKKLSIELSIGIATSDFKYDKADKMLKNADTAMYRSKSHGRNCYSNFNENIVQQPKQTFQVINELPTTLENNKNEESYLI